MGSHFPQPSRKEVTNAHLDEVMALHEEMVATKYFKEKRRRFSGTSSMM